MVFPTVVSGPDLMVTDDPTATSFDFIVPSGSYEDSDILLWVGSGATQGPPTLPGSNSGSFHVDTGSVWKPSGGPVIPMVARLHDGDDSPLQAVGDWMAGAGAIMGFRNAQVALAGFIETNVSFGITPITITVNPSFAETTETDRLCYLFIGSFRNGPSPSLLPRLTPGMEPWYSGITSSDFSWTEIATDPATFVHMYELDGGIPSGTTFDGTENYATFDVYRNGYSDGAWVDAIIVHAAYDAPEVLPSIPLRKRQLSSQIFTARRGPQASR